jgi:hypothetical protein
MCGFAGFVDAKGRQQAELQPLASRVAMVIFASMAFWGPYFIYRAFCISFRNPRDCALPRAEIKVRIFFSQ